MPEEHAILTTALRGIDRRFLVIIDDLDRLSPEDALLIFKLVKSVGRLPNVMYLMVFDRELTEASVAQRFPSEGAHCLEKIVQAAFELPPPQPDDLRDLLLGNVRRIMGEPDADRAVRFMNVAADGSLIRLPDLVEKMFRWRDLIGEGGIERVRDWLAERLSDDDLIVALAGSFVSSGWSQTAGDVVARRTSHLNRGNVEELLNPEAFRARIAALLQRDDLLEEQREALIRFELVWARPDRGSFGD